MQQLEREEGEAWSATAWTMEGSWADNLPERITGSPDVWFQLVQARCLAEERQAKIERAKLTIDDLTDAVMELGELYAAQDDAIVELAELIAG